MVVSVGIAGGREGNRAERACRGRVGRVVVLKQLDVGAEFELHGRKVSGRNTGNDRERAQETGDACGGREHVETPDSVGHHVHDKKFGDTIERKAMNGGAEALLDSADGLLNFADVAVGRNDVKMDGGCGIPDGRELVFHVQTLKPRATLNRMIAWSSLTMVERVRLGTELTVRNWIFREIVWRKT